MYRILFCGSLLAVLLNSSCQSEHTAKIEETYLVTRPIRMDTTTTKEYVVRYAPFSILSCGRSKVVTSKKFM